PGRFQPPPRWPARPQPHGNDGAGWPCRYPEIPVAKPFRSGAASGPPSRRSRTGSEALEPVRQTRSTQASLSPACDSCGFLTLDSGCDSAANMAAWAMCPTVWRMGFGWWNAPRIVSQAHVQFILSGFVREVGNRQAIGRPGGVALGHARSVCQVAYIAFRRG